MGHQSCVHGAAVDPVADIGRICREHGIWLHVDAAYAGVAAVCPELRWLNNGMVEYADSYCTNPHKWLLTTFDCDAFWVADRRWLTDALTILPEFLRNAPNATGTTFLTHTKIRDEVVLRIATGGTFTEFRHVQQSWQVIQQTATQLHAENGRPSA